MKFLVLALICILAFSGCAGNNLESNPQNDSLSHSSYPDTSSETCYLSEISDNERTDNSEYVADNPLYSYLGTVDGVEMYKKTTEETYSHKVVILGTNGNVNSLNEEITNEYIITDAYGNPLINHPFYDFELLPPEAIRASAYEDSYAVIGHYDGDYYRYYFIDGEFVLETHEEKGEYTLNIPDWDNEPFGYKRTRYYYNAYAKSYEGLNDSEGNVIFEPVHNGISVPFEDRFLLGSGSGDGSVPEERVFTLVDIHGNRYAQFNLIKFIVFDDGSYVGVAWSAGNDSPDNMCYDENGNPWDEGYWFLDKNGNILSERFENIGFAEISSANDTIVAVDKNGSTIDISVSDYACNP